MCDNVQLLGRIWKWAQKQVNDCLLLTKNKYEQTAGNLATVCVNIQALFMLWECAICQLTTEEVNSKLRLDRYLGKDCLACGSIQGQNRGARYIMGVG